LILRSVVQGLTKKPADALPNDFFFRMQFLFSFDAEIPPKAVSIRGVVTIDDCERP
jgi:hypothetical protein